MEIRMMLEVPNRVNGEIFQTSKLDSQERRYVAAVQNAVLLKGEYSKEMLTAVYLKPHMQFRTLKTWEEKAMLCGLELMTFSEILCFQAALVTELVQRGMVLDDAWRHVFLSHFPILAFESESEGLIVLDPPFIYGKDTNLAQLTVNFGNLAHVGLMLIEAAPIAKIIPIK